MKKILKYVKPLEVINKIEDYVLVAAFSFLILLSFSQIVMRNLFSTGLFWGDAASRYLVLWVGLIGAMIATREDNHISIDIISKFASKRVKLIIRLITDITAFFISSVLTYAAIIFIIDEYNSGIMAFSVIPTWTAGIILPIAFSIISLRYLLFLIEHLSLAVSGDFPDESQNFEETS